MKPRKIKVRPNKAYKLLGTDLVLDPNKTYTAVYAMNIPDWKDRKLIFIGPSPGFLLEENEYLLEEDEYTIIEQ
jgi:hypothetical protein